MRVIKLLVIGLCGLSCLVTQTSTAGTQAQSPSSAVASSTPAARKTGLKLQLVFHGYPRIGVPQSGAAEITERGLSNMRDITFTRIGGELSPNGRLIAYDSCSNAKRGIYVADPNGSNAQLVAPITGEYCVYVRWSPDGSKISFEDPADPSLKILDIATRQQTFIPNTSGVGWHWWSPSGDEIVYEQSPIATPGRLLHITDLSGNRRQLTFARDFLPCEHERNIVDTWAPAWAPGGDAIAFTQCSRLFVISPTGKKLAQLSPSFAYSPRWSADGQWIFFIDDKSFLKRISVDGKTIVKVGRLPYWGGPFSIAPLD